MAKETLGAQQLRYKKAYDSHVRALTAEISPGDLAYVRSYVAQKDLSRKLIFPAVCPFEVTRVSPDRRNLSCSTMVDRAFIAVGDRSTWPLPDCFLGHSLSFFLLFFMFSFS
jgi:hypothetical protein